MNSNTGSILNIFSEVRRMSSTAPSFRQVRAAGIKQTGKISSLTPNKRVIVNDNDEKQGQKKPKCCGDCGSEGHYQSTCPSKVELICSMANSTSRSSGVGGSSLPKQPVWTEAGKSRNEAIDTVKKWNTGQGKTAKQFNSEQVRVTNDGGSEIIETKRVSGGKIAMLACATGVFASTLREFSEKNPNAVHNIEFTEDVTGNKYFKRAF